MRLTLYFLLALLISLCPDTAFADRPNVILILTDDQGYGDLSCHGNPILKTPALDDLHGESLRFTDFHVNSFCTPSRASLMTGHYATRTGAYRTSSGRTFLHTDEVTMAEIFRDNGYATGIFGKWHLGDSYPHRPYDRGFEDVVWHKAGGVGQLSDFHGNDYFDDHYERNGELESFEGYCTDIWFEEALRFIKAQQEAGKPFFAYIPTNAPHSPFVVEDHYAAPYEDVATWRDGKAAKFFGMIANLDENVARLRQHLKTAGLADNTILIFMSDNGTAGGVGMDTDAVPSEGEGYNAGMRGRKASVYDGGHRVPFFLHWPGGGFDEGQDVDTLAAGYDVLPTLIDMCQLEDPDIPFDGTSLVPAVENPDDWPDRELVLQYQGGNGFTYAPEMWTDSAVLTEEWRLVDGDKLFRIKDDPSQSHNMAEDFPEVVKQLRSRYEGWWADVSPRMQPIPIHLGNKAEPGTLLTGLDWYMEPFGNPVTSTKRWTPGSNGPIFLEIETAGRYRFALTERHPAAEEPLRNVLARLEIGGQEFETRIEARALAAEFVVTLPEGPAKLIATFETANGETGGAYFVEASYLDAQ
ncbi:MAG: arylsulfatase [Verrucomicrobiales bacterium]|nr:arylsulfatase [Verrucomicrobiales bacterium]